jgi:hypothetical protein
LTPESFDSDIRKRINKLSSKEKDFLLIMMFELLWESYDKIHWESIANEIEYEHLNSIFRRIFS